MRLVHQILVHVQTPKKLVSPLLQSLLPLVDDVVVPWPQQIHTLTHINLSFQEKL